MEEWLRIRIVYIDYYYDDQKAAGCKEWTRQPIIRIFGSTLSGQKCCVHVHNVLPYFYVQLPHKHCRDLGEAQAFSKQLVDFLNSVSNFDSTTQRAIAGTEIVERIPFYGYQRQSCFFLKIYTYVPRNIQQLADLCFRFPHAEVALQPYESHISYLSQFMIDYNLYGMNFVRISNPRFRLPLPLNDTFPWKENDIPYKRAYSMSNVESFKSQLGTVQDDISNTNLLNISPSQRVFLSEHCEELSHFHCISPNERKSYCDLELDIDAIDILNPEDCKEIPLLEDASDEDRLVPSLRGLWEEDGRRRRLLGMESYSDGVESKDNKCQVNLNYSEAHLREAFLQRMKQEERLSQSTDGSLVTSRLERKEDNTSAFICQSVAKPLLEEKTKQGSHLDGSRTCLEEDNDTEDLWNDILQSSQLLERDINQEISEELICAPYGNDDAKRMMMQTHEEPVLSHQNDEDVSSTVALGRENVPFEGSLSRSCLQESIPSNPLVSDPLETSYASSPRVIASISQVQSDTNNESKMLFNQPKNYHALIWITPRDSPPKMEDLKTTSMKSSFCKYVPQVTLDTYGRLNTRMIANCCKDSEENRKITSILETDYFSCSEDEDRSIVPESHNSVRPSSPRYDEMDTIAETVQSPYQSLNGRKRLRFSDSSFFSPGFAVETEHNMSSGRESSLTYDSQQDDELLPHQSQGLTSMSLEVVTKSRKECLPDPRVDEVRIVCMAIHDERAKLHLGPTYQDTFHVILWMEDPNTTRHPFQVANEVSIQVVSNEEELFYKVAHWIRYYDVDMIFGYDIHRSSLGYLIERGRHLGWDFTKWISRWKEAKQDIHGSEEEEEIMEQKSYVSLEASRADAYMKRLGCHIKILGRYVFCIWNILRVQVKLPYYDYEGASATILKKRVPAYEPWVLGSFVQNPQQVYVAYEYCLQKTADNLNFLEELDWISQTSELARIFGIDFRSVITRGSQFRVESMLARLAHANGYLLLSASREQLLNQPAMECLPLVMEPFTNFYQDPVIVMDFQSLYPSIIIAHNLCFCTIFGKVSHVSPSLHTSACRLGVLESYEPPFLVTATNDKEHSTQALYERYVNDYYVAPNGECFVTKTIRKGILPRLLQEILSTRLMIKSSMKWIAEHYQGEHKDRLWKILNAQQFALKLIANVTYGYTSAAFSGRMPCSGLADAIVQHGRQAMKRSIEEIEKGWQQVQAHVVYGDTDSLFVRVPELDWRQAWNIGMEMTKHISRQFPYPMRLVLEKVYEPCILLVKKRYVGYAYESLEQQSPIFDAKGIETIRRDSCAAVQKLVERSLRLLFDTRKVSKVKEYLLKKWSRMHRGNMHWMDFIFYMEVRWGTYRAQMEASSHAVLPPAAVVASRRVFRDPRAVPLYGERVPFLVAYWMEKPRTLQDCVCSPQEFLSLQERGHAVLHVTYYITKQMIPALQRFLSCFGIEVHQWYQQMKRPSTLLSWLLVPRKKNLVTRQDTDTDLLHTSYPVGGLYHYYHYYICCLCGQNLYNPKEWPLCPSCRNHPSWSSFMLCQRWNRQQRKLKRLETVCDYCSRHGTRLKWHCQNFHCPIFFQRHSSQQWNDAYKDIIDCLQW